MYVLCDTCSVLMLIRITPDMFCDARFECVTIPDVRKEMFQTQKFKSKYPWRTEYKKKVKALGATSFRTKEVDFHLKLINNLIDSGLVNKRTGRNFDLSRVDKLVAACALANDYGITTGDVNLIDFMWQEFSKNNISPLGLINKWIQKGLIEWDDHLQVLLEDWDKHNESRQPVEEIEKFARLTGYKYFEY